MNIHAWLTNYLVPISRWTVLLSMIAANFGVKEAGTFFVLGMLTYVVGLEMRVDRLDETLIETTLVTAKEIGDLYDKLGLEYEEDDA